MNPEIKEKWVTALRSGEYKQGQDRLKKGDQFCCLGVLCDLHAKETGRSWAPLKNCAGDEYLRAYTIPPFTVCKWADYNPAYNDKITTLNDIEKADFNKIADFIEENF
jgi:hypothetical protein